MATGITISILQQYFSRLIAKFLNCTSDLLIRHDRGGKIVIFRQWQPGAAWNAKSNDWLDLRVTIVGALLLSSAAEQLCSISCLRARTTYLLRVSCHLQICFIQLYNSPIPTYTSCSFPFVLVGITEMRGATQKKLLCAWISGPWKFTFCFKVHLNIFHLKKKYKISVNFRRLSMWLFAFWWFNF